MVTDLLSDLGKIFAACSNWFTSILTATDGSGVIISAFLIYLIVSLLIIPFRGSRLNSFAGFSDRVRMFTNKGSKK